MKMPTTTVKYSEGTSITADPHGYFVKGRALFSGKVRTVQAVYSNSDILFTFPVVVKINKIKVQGILIVNHKNILEFVADKN